MGIIIRKVSYNPNTGDGFYQLEDEVGNVLDHHISSSDSWAIHDLIADKPEYYNTPRQFIDDTVVKLEIVNNSEDGFYLNHIDPECAILHNESKIITISETSNSNYILSTKGSIEIKPEVINDNIMPDVKTASFDIFSRLERVEGLNFRLTIY